MCVGIKKPHSPFSAPKEFYDLYNREEMKISDIKAPADIPTHYSLSKTTALLKVHSDTNMYTGETLPDAKKKEMIHGYSACVSYSDYLIGDLIQSLKDNGLYDNTIIVFTSDHGYKLGEYDRWAKFTLHEKDTTVPFLVRAPKIKQSHGKKTKAIIGLIDIYATLAELCKVPVPKEIDGVSFVPTLRDSEKSVRKYIHTFVTRVPTQKADGSEAPAALGGSIIDARGYRYTQWWAGDNKKLPKTSELFDVELYDHYNKNNTPISLKNLSKTKPEVILEMQKKCGKL